MFPVGFRTEILHYHYKMQKPDSTHSTTSNIPLFLPAGLTLVNLNLFSQLLHQIEQFVCKCTEKCQKEGICERRRGRSLKND